jgi:hypothetical protein
MKKNIKAEDKKKQNQSPQKTEPAKKLMKRVQELLCSLNASTSLPAPSAASVLSHK